MSYYSEVVSKVVDASDNKQEAKPIIEAAMEQAYREGYADAVRNYAVWKDGEQLVGAMQRPLKTVLEEAAKQPVPIRY